MANKKQYIQVGTIRLGQEKTLESGRVLPASLYIKFHSNKDQDGIYNSSNLDSLADTILNSKDGGLSLNIEKPKDKIDRFAAMGFYDNKPEDHAENLKANIPDWLKYEITLVK